MANTQTEDDLKCMHGFLSKKENGKKWVEYWVVLQGMYLKFHNGGASKEMHVTDSNLIGWIELTDDTKCILGKKKESKFPFYIEKKSKRFLFKAPCKSSRQRWVTAIELSVHDTYSNTNLPGVDLTNEGAPADETSSRERPILKRPPSLLKEDEASHQSCSLYLSSGTDEKDSISINEDEFNFRNSFDFDNLIDECSPSENKRTFLQKLFSRTPSRKHFVNENDEI